MFSKNSLFLVEGLDEGLQCTSMFLLLGNSRGKTTYSCTTTMCIILCIQKYLSEIVKKHCSKCITKVVVSIRFI